ncbi:MAG: thioredoxin-disulfide reductase [bacterium]
MKAHDIIIIGGGPGGLTAGLYAARADLDCLLLEKGLAGGQMFITDNIENYPGFPEGISGPELSERFSAQVERLGLEIQYAEVEKIKIEADRFLLTTDEGDFPGKTLIISTGANPRELGVPGERRLRGRGVSYCATCDGAFFRDQEIVVVGGGDTAVKEALYLANLASRVRVVHRRDLLRADKFLQKKAFNNPKIEFIWDHVAEEFLGENEVTGIRIKNVKTQKTSTLKTNGIFPFVGINPNTSFLPEEIELDEGGFIKTNEDCETSVPGVFAVGDVRAKKLRQIITAAAEGAIAATAAAEMLD